jgi:hypothetical protein
METIASTCVTDALDKSMDIIENGIKALAMVFLNNPFIILPISIETFGSRIILSILCISSTKF